MKPIEFVPCNGYCGDYVDVEDTKAVRTQLFRIETWCSRCVEAKRIEEEGETVQYLGRFYHVRWYYT